MRESKIKVYYRNRMEQVNQTKIFRLPLSLKTLLKNGLAVTTCTIWTVGSQTAPFPCLLALPRVFLDKAPLLAIKPKRLPVKQLKHCAEIKVPGSGPDFN